MIKLNIFWMSVALKAAAWAWRFKETKKDSPVHRTPGSFASQSTEECHSLVLRTPGSFDSLVHRTPGSLNSPVLRTPGSHFKMLITLPRSKKHWISPWTSLMGPGGAVWGKKIEYKKSCETVPLRYTWWQWIEKTKCRFFMRIPYLVF